MHVNKKVDNFFLGLTKLWQFENGLADDCVLHGWAIFNRNICTLMRLHRIVRDTLRETYSSTNEFYFLLRYSSKEDCYICIQSQSRLSTEVPQLLQHQDVRCDRCPQTDIALSVHIMP